MTKYLICSFFLLAVLICKTNAQSYYYSLNKDNIIIMDHKNIKSIYPYLGKAAILNKNYLSKKIGFNIKMDSIFATSITGGILKNTFMYNQSGNLSEWLIQLDTINGWTNDFRNNYLYDNNNNLISWLELFWNNYKWDSLDLSIYSYNTNKSLFQIMHRAYTDSGWKNISRSTYVHYDLNENSDSLIFETWANNQWQNSELEHFFYSVQNRKDSIYFNIWNGSGWQYDRKTNFYYNNSSTSPDSMLVTYWGGGDLWMNYFKIININDSNNNIIEQTEQDWQAFYWQNAIKRFFTYNDLHFVTSAYCKLWDGSKWIDADGDIVIRNPDGFITGFITNKINIYYSTFTNIEDRNKLHETNFNLSQNYPNPFNPSTTINFSVPSGGQVRLVIYDVLGREVRELVNNYYSKGSYVVKWDGTNNNGEKVNSGIYFYSLKTPDKTIVKKMILAK